MQVASKGLLWSDSGKGTVCDVVMTPETGLSIRFLVRHIGTTPFAVNWGDRTGRIECVYQSGDHYVEHTFASYGSYRIVFENVRGLGHRPLDGHPQYSYDAAIVSFVDRGGLVDEVPSGAFKRAVNLEKFIAPNARWIGQRPFAYCSKLKEVKLGKVVIHYDGSFQYCTSLEKFETEETGICWSYVWQGCTRLAELKLGAVTQFATQDFANCPNLMDIWIPNKTMDQVRQVASAGNITAGYGARFPWSANAATRFHCSDGVVLGNGTQVG
jgi:hypothetical protein